MEPTLLADTSPDQLAELSALCQRSKAYWGYDAAFMDACRDELILTQADVQDDIAVIRAGDEIAGFVQLTDTDTPGELEIDRLYIDPDAIGGGYGKALFQWALAHARQQGATGVRVVADPNAQPFYEAQGARVVGTYPSGSIPGRTLPKMRVDL